MRSKKRGLEGGLVGKLVDVSVRSAPNLLVAGAFSLPFLVSDIAVADTITGGLTFKEADSPISLSWQPNPDSCRKPGDDSGCAGFNYKVLMGNNPTPFWEDDYEYDEQGRMLNPDGRTQLSSGWEIIGTVNGIDNTSLSLAGLPPDVYYFALAANDGLWSSTISKVAGVNIIGELQDAQIFFSEFDGLSWTTNWDADIVIMDSLNERGGCSAQMFIDPNLDPGQQRAYYSWNLPEAIDISTRRDFGFWCWMQDGGKNMLNQSLPLQLRLTNGKYGTEAGYCEYRPTITQFNDGEKWAWVHVDLRFPYSIYQSGLSGDQVKRADFIWNHQIEGTDETLALAVSQPMFYSPTSLQITSGKTASGFIWHTWDAVSNPVVADDGDSLELKINISRDLKKSSLNRFDPAGEWDLSQTGDFLEVYLFVTDNAKAALYRGEFRIHDGEDYYYPRAYANKLMPNAWNRIIMPREDNKARNPDNGNMTKVDFVLDNNNRQFYDGDVMLGRVAVVDYELVDTSSTEGWRTWTKEGNPGSILVNSQYSAEGTSSLDLSIPGSSWVYFIKDLEDWQRDQLRFAKEGSELVLSFYLTQSDLENLHDNPLEVRAVSGNGGYAFWKRDKINFKRGYNEVRLGVGERSFAHIIPDYSDIDRFEVNFRSGSGPVYIQGLSGFGFQSEVESYSP
ncbi:MAG: hypothetical protein ABIE22_00575 [archaeon]